MAENVRQDGQDRTGGYQKLPVQKRILRLVVSALNGLLVADHVDNRGGCENVYHLHDGIVDGVERRKQIQVSSQKDDEKEFVGADGNA